MLAHNPPAAAAVAETAPSATSAELLDAAAIATACAVASTVGSKCSVAVAPCDPRARSQPSRQLFANAAIAASRVTCSSVSGLNFLIRRSQLQILLLHNGR